MSVEQHELVLLSTYPTGAEEWFCPTCGRRMLLQWPAGCEALTLERGQEFALAWGREVGTAVATKHLLDPGDAEAFHSGQHPDIGLELAPEAPAAPDDDSGEPAGDMALWQNWLEDLDFGDWDQDNPTPA
jgi:hypothetical protein